MASAGPERFPSFDFAGLKNVDHLSQLPARQGQQRSSCKMRPDLSWALAHPQGAAPGAADQAEILAARAAAQAPSAPPTPPPARGVRVQPAKTKS
jgi:hypothetical protein